MNLTILINLDITIKVKKELELIIMEEIIRK